MEAEVPLDLDIDIPVVEMPLDLANLTNLEIQSLDCLLCGKDCGFGIDVQKPFFCTSCVIKNLDEILLMLELDEQDVKLDVEENTGGSDSSSWETYSSSTPTDMAVKGSSYTTTAGSNHSQSLSTDSSPGSSGFETDLGTATDMAVKGSSYTTDDSNFSQSTISSPSTSGFESSSSLSTFITYSSGDHDPDIDNNAYEPLQANEIENGSNEALVPKVELVGIDEDEVDAQVELVNPDEACSAKEDQIAGPVVAKIFHIYQNANMAAMNPDLGWGEVETGMRLQVRRTHVNSPMDFFVKDFMMSDVSTSMEQRILSIPAIQLSQLEEPKVGTLCLAPDFTQYFRAEVVDIGPAKCRVFYLDYGHTAIVAKKLLRQLPDEFQVIPRQVVNFRWDMAVAGELSPEQIETIFTEDILPVTATHKIGPGQYMISIGELEVSEETEFKFFDDVDPANPTPNYTNYSK